jgi:Transposase IS200 like
MDEHESLNHSKWECKYHVVFIPKCRRKTLYFQLRQYLGEVFRKLAEQKESRIEEGHLTGCGNRREVRVFPGSAGVRQTFGVRIYGFLLCCRARIMPRDRLLA